MKKEGHEEPPRQREWHVKEPRAGSRREKQGVGGASEEGGMCWDMEQRELSKDLAE